jgi:hypothetical protein
LRSSWPSTPCQGRSPAIISQRTIARAQTSACNPPSRIRHLPKSVARRCRAGDIRPWDGQCRGRSGVPRRQRSRLSRLPILMITLPGGTCVRLANPHRSPSGSPSLRPCLSSFPQITYASNKAQTKSVQSTPGQALVKQGPTMTCLHRQVHAHQLLVRHVRRRPRDEGLPVQARVAGEEPLQSWLSVLKHRLSMVRISVYNYTLTLVCGSLIIECKTRMRGGNVLFVNHKLMMVSGSLRFLKRV